MYSLAIFLLFLLGEKLLDEPPERGGTIRLEFNLSSVRHDTIIHVYIQDLCTMRLALAFVPRRASILPALRARV